MKRSVGRYLVVGVLAYSAGDAFRQAFNEGADLLHKSAEALPGVFAFQTAIGVLAFAACIGVWRRKPWAIRGILAWGVVTATFVALLQPLLNLDPSARAGLYGGSAAILSVAALLAWLTQRDRRAATSAVAPTVQLTQSTGVSAAASGTATRPVSSDQRSGSSRP